jgi:MFS family permease
VEFSLKPLLQSIQRTLKPQGHVFRGWWIVGAGGLVQFTGALLFFQAFGAYVLLIEAEFGWSKALMAGAFALARVESGLLGPIQGWMVDRYGPRAVIRWGLVIFGLALIGFSRIETIIEFYVYFFFIALGTSLGGFLSVTVALVNWFTRHRAKALALSQFGFSFGGILVPITVYSLETFGWRATAVGSGIIILLTAWPLTRIIDHRPEHIGETPDGIPRDEPEQSIRRQQHSSPSVFRRTDFTAGEALRTPAFWFMSLGHGTSLLIVGAVMVHLVLHVNGQLGYSLTVAGLIVSLMTAMQIVGLISTGILGDRVDKRIIVSVCMFFHAAGLLLLAYAQNIWMVVGFAALHGVAWGTRGPLMQAIRADYFGATNFGSIMGWSSMIVMFGMGIGPIYAGYMADRTGSYQFGFTTLAITAIFGAFFFMLARRPQLPQRISTTEPTPP